jgi:hypothetical protein
VSFGGERKSQGQRGREWLWTWAIASADSKFLRKARFALSPGAKRLVQVLVMGANRDRS